MKETIIKVQGMVCGGCENRVKNALKNIVGVDEVIADHNKNIVKVITSGSVSEDKMKDIIENLDFEVIGFEK